MIDPITSLAFTLNSNEGIYSLLIGSGVSRSSGIPTGWEIVIDLIKKIALLSGEDCSNNPVEWYKNKYGKYPNYSDILNELVNTQTERQQLLKSYFEPTEDEIANGLKIPTKAHHSIAQLVSNKTIKLIITTNFDRLLEKALEEIDITPNVISTDDELKGALPLVHSTCTLLKINGDYLDTRIRNTESELAKYPKYLSTLLDRIFEEFGLIVCGWSGEWDTALVNSILNTRTRRFGFYWSNYGNVGNEAKRIIDFKQGIQIDGYNADNFFVELAEKINALKTIERQHPISIKIAIANAKKYLSEDKFIINLHDLLITEAIKVSNESSNENFPVTKDYADKNVIQERVAKYESIYEIMIGLFIHLCYWGNNQHLNILIKSFELAANPKDERLGGLKVLLDLKYYPGLLLLYSGGIAALANNNYKYLKTLLVDTKIFEDNNEYKSVTRLNTYILIEKDIAAMLPGRNERNYTPFSDYLFDFLRKYFEEIIPNAQQYESIFDRFEYLLSLVYTDLHYNPKGRFWAPTGSFGWRNLRYNPEKHISKKIEKEIEGLGENWPLLKIGLFNNSVDRIKTIKKNLDNFYLSFRWF